jgi:acyl carrier protein
MNADQAMQAIITAIRTETGDVQAQIDATTAADDVEGWDSLSHVRIVMRIEAILGLTIDMDRSYGAANVGELLALVLESPSTGKG